MTGDIIATRTVFERMDAVLPNEQAWLTYIKFEQRCGKFDNARNLYERMLEQIPEESVILSELVHGVVLHQVRKVGGAPGQPVSCRAIFERSLTELSLENIDEDL